MTALVALTLGLLVASTADGQYDTLNPATVSDTHGNTADRYNNLTWAPLPSGVAYEDASAYDDKGLGAFMNLAKSFVNTVQKLDLDQLIEIFTGLTDGDMAFLTDDIMGFVLGFVGIGVCIVLGLLYILLVPLVGCCFCCCRCCCKKCGGDLKQKKSGNDNCCCFVWTIIVTITTVFMAAGAFCTYSAGNLMTSSLDTMLEATQKNLDNAVIFANNTVDEIEYIADDNFAFVADVAIRDLNNIGYLVGVPVRNEFQTNGGVDNVVSSIIALDSTLQSVATDLIALNASIADLGNKADALSTALSTVKTDVENAKNDASCTDPGCAAIDTSVLVMDFDYTALPDLSQQIADINSARATNLTAVALDAKQGITDIPETVHNETKTIVSDLKTLISNFTDEIKKAIGDISDLPADLTEMMDDISTEIDNVLGNVDDFDQYRKYVGVILASITIIVVLLQTLGVLLGCLCYRKNKLPTQRNCGSNCGGLLLYAALGFIYIFSWLLMLLTMILFILGTPLQVYVCGPLTDENFEVIADTVDTPGVIFDDYVLGKALLDNGSIPLKVSDTLIGCRNNRAVWDVLMLDHNKFFDINDVTNYKSEIDVENQLNGINVDLSHIEVLSTATRNQLDDFKRAVAIDFQAFIDELNEPTVAATDLTAYANNLRSVASNVAGAAASGLNQAANDIDGIVASEYPAVTGAQSQVLADVQSLQSSTNPVNTTVDNVLAAGTVTDNYLTNNASGLISQEATNFANRILYAMDQFVDKVLYSLNNDLAKCKPIYDVYDSLVGTVLCKATVEVLNAFWCSMGWSILFMFFSLIFNVKLAKYFRKMNSCEGYDDVTKETENMHDSYPSPHAAPHHASRHAAPQQASRHAAPQQASRYAAPQQASRHAAPQQASRHASPPRGYTNSAYYSPHAQHYASGYATPSRGNMYGSSYPSPYAAPHYASHGAPHPNYEMQVQFRMQPTTQMPPYMYPPQPGETMTPEEAYAVKTRSDATVNRSPFRRMYPTTQHPPYPGAGPPRIGSSNKVGHYDH